MTEVGKGQLRYRVSCECGDDHTGEAESYPEAWKKMDEWKQPHNWTKHPSRGKPWDHYRWRETVEVIGDRTPFDGLQPVPPEERVYPSRMRELLGMPQREEE
jgi:hypothetical protein